MTKTELKEWCLPISTLYDIALAHNGDQIFLLNKLSKHLLRPIEGMLEQQIPNLTLQ